MLCIVRHDKESLPFGAGLWPLSTTLVDLCVRRDWQSAIALIVKQRGRERKGPPEIIQKSRLRNWPISSADFPMNPMEETEHHFGPF